MRVIRKVKLTEADANPLDVAVSETTSTELVMQAILKAVGSESGAICEYNQILTLIEKADNLPNKDKIKETIEDIKHEEEKHMAQLNECAKLFDKLKAGLEDGAEEFSSGEDKEAEKDKKIDEKESVKESLTEAVKTDRNYSTSAIMDIIVSKYDLSTEDYDNIQSYFYTTQDEITGDEVNSGLNKLKGEPYKFDDAEIVDLEKAIEQSVNPKEERLAEFKDDVENDIYYIKNLVAEDIHTVRAAEKLNELAENLANEYMNLYDGDENTLWTLKYVPDGESIGNKKLLH